MLFITSTAANLREFVLAKIQDTWQIEYGDLDVAIADEKWQGSIVSEATLTKPGRITRKLIFGDKNWFMDVPGLGAGTFCTWVVDEIFEHYGIKGFSLERWDENTLQGFLAPPIFWVGRACRGHAVYLDIKAAYWAIYRRFPLMLSWESGDVRNAAGPRFGEILPGWWANFKELRNSLTGLWRSRWIYRVANGKIRPHFLKWSPYRSRSHWLAVRAILDYIAYAAVRVFHASYWHTDGGIWFEPHLKEAWNFVCWLWEDLGLEVSIKSEGYCHAWGVGRYQFGIEQPTPDGGEAGTSYYSTIFGDNPSRLLGIFRACQ